MEPFVDDCVFDSPRGHFVSGDWGVSEWLLSGTNTDGERIDVRGCDIWSFRGEKIAVKKSFWKIRPA